MAFFAKVTRIDISEQELRKDVEGISSPSPQPEDPERALDPGLEEDRYDCGVCQWDILSGEP